MLSDEILIKHILNAVKRSNGIGTNHNFLVKYEG